MSESKGRAAADPVEQKWWAGKRDQAYAAMMEGATLVEIAERLGVCRGTLYQWRSHPFWRERLAAHRKSLLERHEDRLRAVEDAAVEALVAHVAKEASTAMEFLHRRGVVSKPNDKVEVTEKMIWVE